MDHEPQGSWRLVAWSMGAGALYDLAFASAILFWSRPAASLLGISLPAELTYFRFNGILLLLLGGIYLLPAFAPQRYQGVILLAVLGRFLGFIYLGSVYLSGQVPAFLGLALGDLAFSILHATLLFLTGRCRRG